LFGATGSVLHQFARYSVVASLAFVVDFGSLYVLTESAGLHYLVSAAVAFYSVWLRITACAGSGCSTGLSWKASRWSLLSSA
jgi:hypothetical protein